MRGATTGIESGTRLEIFRAGRRLSYFAGHQNVRTYPVAVGKPSTPTPLGVYKVMNKIINPGGVLGTRWMGLNVPAGNYGIHGTNNPSSIGKFISNGCIRMHNSDVEALFPMVTIGTPVIITDRTGGGHSGQPDTAPAGEIETYLVKPGDTLWKISRMYNIPVDVIVKANNIANPDVLSPGQVLTLPFK